MNSRKIIIIVIITVCILSLAYGIFFEIDKINRGNNPKNETEIETDEKYNFDDLFDNSIHFQNYNFRNEYKADTAKELVYSVYSFNEKKDGKYDIKVELPYINLNSSKVYDINTEIILTFGQKVQSILANADKENSENIIYTVEYTAYLNENILSLVIRATLKEGNNAQRDIIKAYTYNVSSNEVIPLKTMIEIKELDELQVKNQIIKVVQEGIDKTQNLIALGYNIYQRNLSSDIYELENSNNYFLGPDGRIYIIYAYGNMNYTSEKDVVVIK